MFFLNRLTKRERDFKNLEARVKALEIENQDYKNKNDFLTNDNNRKSEDLTVSFKSFLKKF